MSSNNGIRNNKKVENDKSEIPKIVCMPASIRVFRIYGGFPAKDKLLNPGKMFYLRFTITAIYCSLILVGSVLHLVKNVKGKYQPDNDSTTTIF